MSSPTTPQAAMGSLIASGVSPVAAAQHIQTGISSGAISPQMPSANAATGVTNYGGGFGTPGQGAFTKSFNMSPADKSLMARAMVSEGGGIGLPGSQTNLNSMQAVGDVTRNRMMSSQFPASGGTLSGVINQPGQFSVTQPGRSGVSPINAVSTSNPQYSRAAGLAGAIMSGELTTANLTTGGVVGNSLNFANLSTVNNKPGYSSGTSKANFNAMQPAGTISSPATPGLSHTFGTIGPNDVSFNGPLAQSLAASQPAQPNPVLGGAIPQPQQMQTAQMPNQMPQVASRQMGAMPGMPGQMAPGGTRMSSLPGSCGRTRLRYSMTAGCSRPRSISASRRMRLSPVQRSWKARDRKGPLAVFWMANPETLIGVPLAEMTFLAPLVGTLSEQGYQPLGGWQFTEEQKDLVELAMQCTEAQPLLSIAVTGEAAVEPLRPIGGLSVRIECLEFSGSAL
jgi:hypothetical protein